MPRIAASRIVPFFVLTASASLSLQCSDPMTSLSRDEPTVTSIGQGIMGGTDDQADPAVVGIFINMGYGAGMCSGSLIAPNLVLTARHCVAEVGETIQCGKSKFGNLYDTSSFRVTTEWDGLQKAAYSYQFVGNWFNVSKVWVPDDPNVCGYDIALIELSGAGIPSSVARPLVPLLDARMAPGDEYVAIGLGSTNDYGSGAGKRRKLEGLHAYCVGNCNPFVMNNPTEWQGDRGICQGDSGGPAFDSQGRVAGVVSRGGAGCTTPIYGDVSAWSDWIRIHAKTAATDGNYPPPAWVDNPVGAAGAGGAAGAPNGGAAGEAAAGAAGQAQVGPEVGTACDSPSDCGDDLVCVYENSVTKYCAPRCSADDDSCPDGMSCDVQSGACFYDGAFGKPCAGGGDCRSGVCVADAQQQYCSERCSAENTVCPDPATCDVDKGVCFLPHDAAQTPEDAPVSDSGICSVALPGVPSSHDSPWGFIWLVVAGWLALRRRSV